MGDTQMKKGGKNMTTSPTRKARYAEYKAHKTRDKHKIKNVLQSSGFAEAERYAGKKLLLGFLSSMTKG
jgi:hypothetical protein